MAVTEDPRSNLRPYLLLPSIDMSSLTQSELHSLSLLSNTPSNDAVSISLKLNPSFFNQSSSSRQQTYSTSLHKHRRRHCSSLESNLIVNFLKCYLQFDDSTPQGERKRKKENVNANVRVEIVNRNGVVVDLVALKEEREKEDGGPYGGELRRRAAGMRTEGELLEMLGAIEGKWCSPRKKTRVVQACFLGDALPLGWKLILALRRKSGRFSPYCRRYISPTGEHLSSCKEVSSYLQSYFGINDANLLRDGVDELQNDVSLIGIDNLPDVKVSNLYECRTCNVSFDVNDRYLHHLRSFHQKTTRRYKLGSSVGAGVIIKDGKYGCQFCHKVFEERRYYLGHVGNHVKGSKKDALVELSQSSIQEISPVLEKEPSSVTNVNVNKLAHSKIIDDELNSFDKVSKLSSACPNEISTKELNQPCDKVTEISNIDLDINGSSVCPKELQMDCEEDKSSSKDLNQRHDRETELSMFNGNINDSTLHELEMDCGEDKSSSKELNQPHDKVTDILMIVRDINDSSACPNELEMDCGDDKSSCNELSPGNKVSEISMTNGSINDSSACPNKLKLNCGEDKSSSEELNQSHDKVTDISMTDRDINDSSAYPKELEMNCGVDKSSSKELNRGNKVSEISMTNGNINDSIACTNKLEMEKDGWAHKTSLEGLNPHDKVSEMSITDGKTKEEAFTCNMLDFKKNFAENIHYLLCNEKLCDVNGVDEGKIQSNCVDILELERAQEYDDREVATVSGESHASTNTVPQPSLYSSVFDEILEREGPKICSLDQNLGSMITTEYTKLDIIEPQMYNLITEEDSITLTELSMDLENNTGLGVSIGCQSDFPLHRILTTTMCVWCGIEFCHEMVDVESEQDSVGFMCSTCRAKISKQFNELESNFFLNPRYY